MIFIDSAEYLLLGGHLASGEGYTHASGNPHIGRGPVLPGLISVLILLFGRDVENLAWGIRLLALANPLLAYLLIRRVSGPIAGLLAAAFVTLFSYTATITEAFNIDTTLLTVYLLALLTLLVAVQTKDDHLLALLSGLLLGASILTKETAFTNLPLALLAALLLGWNVRGVFLHYLGVFVVCLPWWAWVWSISNKVYLVGSLPTQLRLPAVAAILVALSLAVGLYISGIPTRPLASDRQRGRTGWLLAITWVTVMSGLLLTTSPALADSSLRIAMRFVVDNLSGYTPLWPLLLVAGGYVVWKAARGYPHWQFYAVVLAVQVPVCLLTTVEGWSLRQFLIPQVLLLCALAALVVEVSEAAIRRQRPYGWLAIVAAASLAIFLSISAVIQVRTLLGEPDNWRSFDRTSRVSEDSERSVSVVRKMQRWMAGNVPKGERILEEVYYSNYLIFLDGERHRWTGLTLDCEVGRRNPTTTGCLPSETIAEVPPKPTIWFYMEEDCKAIALSMPTLLKQLEQNDSNYLLLSNNPQYPGILGAAQYLVDSGAFKISHVEKVGSHRPYGEVKTVILLKRTHEAPEAVPTRMDANTVNHLTTCEATEGSGYTSRIRSKFPNGIALEPIAWPRERTLERLRGSANRRVT